MGGGTRWVGGITRGLKIFICGCYHPTAQPKVLLIFSFWAPGPALFLPKLESIYFRTAPYSAQEAKSSRAGSSNGEGRPVFGREQEEETSRPARGARLGDRKKASFFSGPNQEVLRDLPATPSSDTGGLPRFILTTEHGVEHKNIDPNQVVSQLGLELWTVARASETARSMEKSSPLPLSLSPVSPDANTPPALRGIHQVPHGCVSLGKRWVRDLHRA